MSSRTVGFARLALAAAFVSASVVALAAAPGAGPAPAGATPLESWARRLDGSEFLEDEPVWMCDENAPGGIDPDARLRGVLRLFGVSPDGRSDRWQLATAGGPSDERDATVRVGELVRSCAIAALPERHPLDVGIGGPLPAGRYEIRRAAGDTTRVLARFRIVTPMGSELQVRAALARAARLRSPAIGREDEAARLYEAVLQRYPRTGYRTAAYWGLWKVRAHTRYANDPSRWLEEMFAHFHDACFGVAAVDVYVADMGIEAARPSLRRLASLYPDTRMARAAARYLHG